MEDSDIPVGDPVRRRAGTVIVATLTLVSVFAVVNWLTKETPSLELRQPWRDDPYDVLVSLDFVVLPVLVLLGAGRSQLCRRYSALPSRRILDLIRVCRAAVAATLITQAAEWIAVALRLHRSSWDFATVWQVVGLAVGTLAMTLAAVRLRGAARDLRQISRPGQQPDWLADAVTLGLRASGGLGRCAPYASRAVRWADTRVLTRVRERPVCASSLVAAGLALPFVLAKIVFEGYPPALAAFSFLLPAMALFALTVIAGRYLRIVAPRSSTGPRGLVAAVAACVSGPTLFAFHDSLLPRHQTVAGLYELLIVGAAAGGVAAVIALHVTNRVRGAKA